MANAGIFTMITNDGKQDRMLMATALLHERLNTINKQKWAQNGGNSTDLRNLPTLLDIEKTHILFTNAHFKPFAAIGFEYNKVGVTGNALGDSVQFSIPQFGDFFHDIACHVILNQPSALTAASGNTNSNSAPLMRWCHFPGERLLKEVSQEVNGNPLDTYGWHATNMHREYRVSPNKRAGWDRCVGQQTSEKGWVEQPNWDGNNATAASVTSRVRAEVEVGNQTPTALKTSQLDLYIPLLFWYNKDVRLAVPSVAIPYGQRFIKINLASADELVGEVPRGDSTTYDWASPGGTLTTTNMLSKIELYINNIFVNPEIHGIYIKRIGFSLIRVHREQTFNVTDDVGDLLLNGMKWPIEYMFVGLKVRDYWSGSTAALKRQHLDKWHTYTTVTEQTYTTSGQNVLREYALSADGTMTAAVASADGAVTFVNSTLATGLVAGDLLKVNKVLYSVASVGTSTVGTAAASVSSVVVAPKPAADVSATTDVVVLKQQGLSVKTQRHVSNLTSLGIKAHGVVIYNPDYSHGFYNSYLPYHFGGPNINTPEDTGLAFIPFCLYPGTYQPSGHINVSRAREFYIKFSTPNGQISNNIPGTLVVVASAINFLLISDGSAVLRYTT
jgi:hypothetical protein